MTAGAPIPTPRADKATGALSGGREARRVVAVVPDVSGLDRLFDYEVPPPLADAVEVGTVVRVPLRGRRVRGWVVSAAATGRHDRELLELADVVSRGPGEDVVALARFAAWRYAGRIRSLLAAASPPRVVHHLPEAAPRRDPRHRASASVVPHGDAIGAAAREALRARRAVLRLPPAASRLAVVTALLALQASDELASSGGDLVVLVPEHHDAGVLVRRLRSLGHAVAAYPGEWADAAAGGRVVVGTRAAVLATVPRLAALLVLDAHDESYVEQRSPTWHAWVLAAERAARAGVPCLLVSACPTLEQLAWGRLVEVPRAVERAGWPAVEIVDRRDDDPRSGLYSPRLAPMLAAATAARPDVAAVCVLDRTGRARLLACGACRELARCPSCGAALVQRERPATGAATALHCPRCGSDHPGVCPQCGSTKLRLLRVGVGRAAEELAALTGRYVAEVSGRGATDAVPASGILVGTQAVLHRVRVASIVVFLDFDQELLAPRFRASEHALALLARAARIVGSAPPAACGDREGRARVVVQTRLAGHDVIEAAARADPDLLARPEAARRAALGLPPERALAALTGDGAAAFAKELRRAGAGRVEVGASGQGRYLVRAPDGASLADAIRAARSHGVDARVEVDPLDA
ncbi:MAG TPA: hypothetical protein VND23_04715 [Acidimicrobiales bacterium]|nr:hypothetical protein [Acidimicrobiales bacterium]